jgi:hypothetical protein
MVSKKAKEEWDAQGFRRVYWLRRGRRGRAMPLIDHEEE